MLSLENLGRPIFCMILRAYLKVSFGYFLFDVNLGDPKDFDGVVFKEEKNKKILKLIQQNKYPVIHFEPPELEEEYKYLGRYAQARYLRLALNKRLNKESARGVAPPIDLKETPADNFLHIISENAKHNKTKRVVVLIDEYDKPIRSAMQLESPELIEASRKALNNLYSVLKEEQSSIRFCMITGISKYAKVSIFSGNITINFVLTLYSFKPSL
jgi:hypothetical protein